jgi:hypothetical protein
VAQQRPIFVVHILEEEYPRFRAGLPKDLRLPPTYAEWRAEALRTHNTHRKSGLKTEAVVVQWDDFQAYAERIRLAPTYAMLTAYAMSHGEKAKAQQG